jgi:hypothetical protein
MGGGGPSWDISGIRAAALRLERLCQSRRGCEVGPSGRRTARRWCEPPGAGP